MLFVASCFGLSPLLSDERSSLIGAVMAYELVIRNGIVVDGSGLARYRADVGVIGDKIAKIGRITEKGAEEIDAEGHVVTPGFIDGHTHMDAQINWDPLGTSSCWHGITSVVMGNCGFTLAPARATERELVVRNLERAEDISAEAMAAGIDWTWETYPEYLQALEKQPKGINYGGYVGHSALRTWAMGERAFSEAASDADMQIMADELRASLRAGALGFTTSRTFNHQTSDDRPVASRIATWDEVANLVRVMGREGAGIFEIAGEDVGRDPEKQKDYYGRLEDLAVETGCPITFGIASGRFPKGEHRVMLDLLDRTAARGGPESSTWSCRSRHRSRLMDCRSGKSFEHGHLMSRNALCKTPPCSTNLSLPLKMGHGPRVSEPKLANRTTTGFESWTARCRPTKLSLRWRRNEAVLPPDA